MLGSGGAGGGISGGGSGGAGGPANVVGGINGGAGMRIEGDTKDVSASHNNGNAHNMQFVMGQPQLSSQGFD